MRIIIVIAILFFQYTVSGQSVQDVLGQVLQAQRSINTVCYKLRRVDTLVTGQTRILKGETKVQRVAMDTIYGFWFWTKRDDRNVESIYDGNSGLEVDNARKEFVQSRGAFAISNMQHRYGQAIFTELIKLDTSRATGFDLSQDDQFYYLTMHLPDITKYDVTNRFKKFSIDKKLMLPVRMKNHQETAGKVQDLYYEAKEIKVNNEKLAYNFSGMRFPSDYKPMVTVPKSRPSAILNKQAPLFNLVAANGEKVSPEQLKGKVALFDFGEVWCGPCLASMPKVQEFYDKYKSKGLMVYGVSFEKSQLDAFEKMVKKLNISFPIFIGDSDMRKAYEVEGIPKYVLIDKTGIVSFISTGYSDLLEEEILKVLK